MLQEHHPALQGPYSVLQGPNFAQPLLEVPGLSTSDAQPQDASNLADSEGPGRAADGKAKPTQQWRVILDPAILEKRRKARAARDAARRAATDPAVLVARRQAAAARRAAKKLDVQAARLAAQEANLEKVRREWAEQQQQQPLLTTEGETMVLGLPGPAYLGQFQFVQSYITPASTSGRSLSPTISATRTRQAELLRAYTRKADAQTQYTVQVVVKSAQAAVLPKVKSVALQTDNRVMGKNSTGPRKGKRCKLIAPSRTLDSTTSTTSHQVTRRRGLRSST